MTNLESETVPEQGPVGGGAGRERVLGFGAVRGRILAKSHGWRAWEFAGLLLGLGVLLRLNFRLDLLWTRAPLLLIAASLLAVILLIRRVPLGVAILWLLGFLSYLWSLTPGDTLLAAVWGLTVVAAAAAGRWRGVLSVVLVFLVSNYLQNALALNAFDLQRYMSGSVHYRMGATALVLVPVAVVGFARGRPRWLALPWWLLATVAIYGTVISGSRGVYVPLVLVLVLLTGRLVRDRSSRKRLIAGMIATAVVLVAADALIPFHPAAAALGAKASTEAQVAAVSTAGGFTQRLRFWDQGVTMAVEHPFGVGLGGFRGTIHAFQRFPMTWSSSPHNVFVETAGTLGWPGLAVLVVLLAVSFWRAWTSSRWPWALALLGIWFTLSVDVTADYPSIVTIAFAVVGACLGPTAVAGDLLRDGGRWSSLASRLRPWLAGLVFVAGTALTAWWFAPCTSTDCVLTRWRGVESTVLVTVPRIAQGDRPAFFARLEKLYPMSLWVLQLEETYATSAGERLSLAREIATRYPLQSWRNYLLWANLSLAEGDLSQAKEAVRHGLDVFGPDARRFPEMRADPKGFEAWLERARAIQARSP